MHFRHRQTDRQTDTDIVAKARDVYITSRAKNALRKVMRAFIIEYGRQLFLHNLSTLIP